MGFSESLGSSDSKLVNESSGVRRALAPLRSTSSSLLRCALCFYMPCDMYEVRAVVVMMSELEIQGNKDLARDYRSVKVGANGANYTKKKNGI